jgi:hypothetical protein
VAQVVEEDLHLHRRTIYSDYLFRISGQAEPTASKGIGTVFRAGCDVGWDFVVADHSVLFGPMRSP